MNFAMFDMNPMMMGKEMPVDFSRKKGPEHPSGLGDFLSRFEKAMKDHSPGSARGGTGMSNSRADSLKDKIDKLMSEAKTPMEFVQALEQIMSFISRGKLENLRIDSQGLAILKEMLSGAGFDPEEVDETFLKISQTIDAKKLPADTLLKGLVKIAPEKDSAQVAGNTPEEELMFPESMIPVIQSILYTLGMEKEVADHAMAKAVIKGRGIQLNELIEQLKNIASQNPRKSFQTPEGDDSFVMLLEQMGLSVEALKGALPEDASLTLNRLIHSLEEVHKTVLKEHEALAGIADFTDTKALQKQIGKEQNALSEALKKIFSMTDAEQAPSAGSSETGLFSEETSLTSLTGSDQEKIQKISFAWHQIKALADQMQGTEEAQVSDNSMKTLSEKDRNDMFNALAEHMKVEEKDSMPGMEVSSEEVKKHHNKMFAMDAAKGEAAQKNDAVMAAAQGEGAQGKTEKSPMEEMLSRKVSAPRTKKTDSNGSQEGMDAITSKRTMTQDAVKRAEAPPRPLPVHVTRQVSKGVLKAIQQGENTLRLQLKPASLGRLLITIDNLGDSMKVSVMTENQAAKDMLNANVNELKGVLANTGINLAQFDVDMGSDFGQSMANTQQGSGGTGKRGSHSGSGKIVSSADGDSLVSSGPDGRSEDADGSLHYVA